MKKLYLLFMIAHITPLTIHTMHAAFIDLTSCLHQLHIVMKNVDHILFSDDESEDNFKNTINIQKEYFNHWKKHTHTQAVRRKNFDLWRQYVAIKKGTRAQAVRKKDLDIEESKKMGFVFIATPTDQSCRELTSK